jgi:TolA-binding protein
MQSTLSPKHPDDPHDILVAPDATSAAPGDEELAKVLRVAARCLADQQPNAAPEVRAAAPAAPSIPPVDTTFRPTAANDDVRLAGHRPSVGSRALRGFTAVLLTACICGAGIVWHSSGDAAKRLIAKWGTQLLLASPLAGWSASPAQPVAEADAANATDSQPASPAEAAAEAVVPAAAPSAEQAQLMQSMRSDLASLGQQVEQLKATIEQLKAGQQQVPRDVAKVSSEKVSDRASEPNLRPKKPPVPSSATSALPPPRLAAAPVRRPVPPPYPAYPPPQAAMAPAVSQTPAPYTPQAAPYVPQQIEPAPPAAAQTLADPELASVPRPPMPLSR